MTRTMIIKGRIVAPQLVEVAVPLPEETIAVEVVAHVKLPGTGRLSEFLRSLPPGTRTKEDIDRQIRDERDSWD